MARKKRRGFMLDWDLERETIHGILVVVFFAVAIVSLLAAFGLAGPIGDRAHNSLSALLGIGYYLIPVVTAAIALSLARSLDATWGALKIVSAIASFVAGLGLLDFVSDTSGGLVGSWIKRPLTSLLDVYASIVILVAVIIISIIILFNIKFSSLSIPSFRRRDRDDNVNIQTSIDEEEIETEEHDEDDGADEKDDDDDEENEDVGGVGEEAADDEFDAAPLKASGRPYVPPPLSLLEKDKGKPNVGDIKANVNIIKRTLANFGIDVEMDEVTIGPSVTRYSLKPAEGVRLQRILSLQNNLELALAAHPVRIEAPIPGRSLVGIEIPNSKKSTVGLATLLGSDAFKNSTKPLSIALGKGISGDSRIADLGKMPHLLIAGATGSGKSVSIHGIITSLLYKNGPDTLKFVLVDPKRVELTLYNGIPQLLTPVITDAKRTIQAMKWLAREMERRYNVFEENHVRDIGSYHEKVLAPALSTSERETPDGMPYIVVVVDELADIMAAYPRELEASIVRLAQMSRAVGIHLILSTQRPSVNVITGLIKANIPARVALQVSSQVDSRTILDASGAEKLLGAGDMLFTSGDMAKPVRLQSSFIGEVEVKKVVRYLKHEYEDELTDEIDFGASGASVDRRGFADEGDDDDLYEEARETIVAAGKASTSYLQRKLRIGYARAARLMDMLEERRVIGPQDGSKPRDVLVPSEGGASGSGGDFEESGEER